MFDKYLYALGRGVRGAKQAFDEKTRLPDPAAHARDITPAPRDSSDATDASRTAIESASTPLARKPLAFGARPLVMGIVNVTPDSFSDGGHYSDPTDAIAHGLRLAEQGADILDVGGESTRPGHEAVEADEELRRVLPVVRALAEACETPVSIDTMKASVAAAALAAGASIVNDVWGLQRDPNMARVVAERGVPVIVMHNRDAEDASIDIVADVLDFLKRSIDIALAAGIARDKIIVDPGIGFGKTNAQSLTLVRELDRLKVLGCPILLGVSRKRLIGLATGRTVARERMAGSLAAAVIGATRGAAIVRVHDVAEHLDAMKVYAAITDREDAETR
jgi:dihydropteroate synthase